MHVNYQPTLYNIGGSHCRLQNSYKIENNMQCVAIKLKSGFLSLHVSTCLVKVVLTTKTYLQETPPVASKDGVNCKSCLFSVTNNPLCRVSHVLSIITNTKLLPLSHLSIIYIQKIKLFSCCLLQYRTKEMRPRA